MKTEIEAIIIQAKSDISLKEVIAKIKSLFGNQIQTFEIDKKTLSRLSKSESDETLSKEALEATFEIDKKTLSRLSKSESDETLSKEALEALNTKDEECYTLENSPAIQKIDQWAKENPELAAQADKELEQEMQSYYNGNRLSS